MRKHRELNEHLDHLVGEDVDSMVEMDRMVDEFIASAKRMNGRTSQARNAPIT